MDHNDEDFSRTDFNSGDVMVVRYQELRQILRAMYALQSALDTTTDIQRNFTFTMLEGEFNMLADMLKAPDSDAIEDKVIADLERRAFTATQN